MIIFSALSQIFRSLKAYRVYNIINILGLSLGLASTFIIFKIILHEWNTDKFHPNYENICYLTNQPNPLSEARISSNKRRRDIKYSDFPEIKYRTDIVFEPESEVKYNNSIFKVPVIEIDSLFPLVFDFPMYSGSFDNILNNPSGIIISKDLSNKIFGTSNTLGETMEFRGHVFTIEGVMQEFPGNSTLKIEAIILHIRRGLYSHPSAEFILINDNVDLTSLNDKLNSKGNSNPRYSEVKLEIKPIKDLYFNQIGSSFYDVMNFGNLKSLRILLLIAILLFAVSTFNYLNIYQVILQKRAKEIGILCIHGGGRRHLSGLFFKENIVFVGISAFIVILFYSLISSYAPVVLETKLPVNPFEDLLLLLGISFLMILLTSAISALRFNRIDPLFYIKELSTGKRAYLSRRISMILQYTVTIALLIVSVFFVKQLNFMLNGDLDFKQENIICIPFFSRLQIDYSRIETEEQEQEAREDILQKIETQKSNMQFVRDEINKNPYLNHLNYGKNPTANRKMNWKLANSDQEYISTYCHFLMPEFIDMYGLQISEGRFFDREKDKDRDNKVVINEAAKRYFNIENITNAQLANRSWGKDKEPWQVIGVVKDYSYEHLSMETLPLIMFFFDDILNKELMIEIAEGKDAESIEFLRDLFEKSNPGKVFTYHFVEDDVERLYQEDKKLVRIYGIFTIIALIICSLGLFSFSIYDVQQRFKEIGIRKANGSGIWETVLFLTKNVLILLGVAFVIAIPLAWLGILKYLEGFAHKAPLSWWIFALAGLFTLLISVLTVITQSYRAASRNPVEALRYE